MGRHLFIYLLVILNRGTVTAQRYIEELIRSHVVPFAKKIAARFKLIKYKKEEGTHDIEEDKKKLYKW